MSTLEFFFIIIFDFYLISKKLSTCQVIIVPRVNVSATCQFMVVLFFFSIKFLYSLFLFNLVPFFVKIMMYEPMREWS